MRIDIVFIVVVAACIGIRFLVWGAACNPPSDGGDDGAQAAPPPKADKSKWIGGAILGLVLAFLAYGFLPLVLRPYGKVTVELPVKNGDYVVYVAEAPSGKYRISLDASSLDDNKQRVRGAFNLAHDGRAQTTNVDIDNVRDWPTLWFELETPGCIKLEGNWERIEGDAPRCVLRLFGPVK